MDDVSGVGEARRGTRGRGATLLCALLVAAIAVGTAVPILDAYFRTDDFGYLAYHWRRPSESLGHFFFAHILEEQDIWGRVLGEMRPVEELSFRLSTLLAGVDPFGHHAVSVGAHVAVSVLVFAFARLALHASRLRATIGAALFAALPCHFEAVSWISSRTDLLVAVLALASLLGWALAHGPDEPPGPGRRAWYALSLVALGLAFLSKESCAVFPLLLPAWDLIVARGRGGGFRLPPLRRYAPLPLLLAAYVAFRFLTLPEAFPTSDGKPVLARLPVFAERQVSYLLALLHPGLGEWSQGSGGGRVAFGAAVLVAFALLSLWAAFGPRRPGRTWREVIYLGPAWYLTTTAPLAFTYMSDRHLYLPSVGLCLAVAGLRLLDGGSALRRAVVAGVASVVVLAAGGGVLALHRAEARRTEASRRAHLDALAALAEQEEGTRVILAPPPKLDGRLVCQWVYPFSLRPPWSPVDHYERLEILETPGSYSSPRAVWWRDRTERVQRWIADTAGETRTVLVAWDDDAGGMVARPVVPERVRAGLVRIREYLGAPANASPPVDSREAVLLLRFLLGPAGRELVPAVTNFPALPGTWEGEGPS